jgi:two-component system chemotaxis response regulator CheY
MKTLVLDDSTTMRRIIANTLKRIGITDIEEAANGQEGIEKYNQSKPDLILTDWNMPEMNGLEFVKRIRRKDGETPIIMITTEGGKREVITALKAGVNNYIVKPFTPQVLKEKLQAVMGTAE